jgi:glutathione S-transferase
VAHELIGLPYSPWSEKARWALDARRVAYEYRVYSPLLGELELRRKLRKWSGVVSVPMLITDDGEAIADSAAIARWADRRGEGPKLFAHDHEAAVVRYVALSERGLNAGRALSLMRTMADDEAVRELVPKRLRNALGPAATALGRFGVQRTFRKYGGTRAAATEHLRALTEVLDTLRAELAGRATLLEELSFADIALAQVLAFVAPPSQGLRLGRASRRTFGDPVLTERYGDLVAWRDALYASHRGAVR